MMSLNRALKEHHSIGAMAPKPGKADLLIPAMQHKGYHGVGAWQVASHDSRYQRL